MGLPILDFKLLNNGTTSLFLTEVVFDIEESHADPAPLLAIREDTHLVLARHLQLINEGWCDLTDLTIAFHLLPGVVAPPPNFDPPYEHTIASPIVTDEIKVDVTKAFQDEGADTTELIRLSNAEPEPQGTFVVRSVDRSEEQMTLDEIDKRWEKSLGKFRDGVGTLAGEISFTTPEGERRKHRVKFYAPVYLANERLLGDPETPQLYVRYHLRDLERSLPKARAGLARGNARGDRPVHCQDSGCTIIIPSLSRHSPRHHRTDPRVFADRDEMLRASI